MLLPLSTLRTLSTLCILCALCALNPARAVADDDWMMPFPIGGGYTFLGGDLGKLFPGSHGTVHYAFGGGYGFFGFDLGVRLVFLQQPEASPWVSVPIYGAIGPGFFFDIPLDDDGEWHLSLRGATNIAWVGVMYDTATADAPQSPPEERVLLYGPSVEASARLSYGFKEYGLRLFVEASNEWAMLQNERRGRHADGYLLHLTAGLATGYGLP